MEEKKIAMTVNEASSYTGIGRNNLRNLIEWEKIPCMRIGRKILIRVEVLDTFMSVNEGNNLKNRHEIIGL